jgi:hypothetical protein
MPKLSVYVTDEEAPVWEEARRLLRFHQDEGLGTHLTPFLRDYIAQENARQAKKKD